MKHPIRSLPPQMALMQSLLSDVSRQINNHPIVGRNRFENKGYGNWIEASNCAFKRSSISIHGNRNYITIGANTRLNNLRIVIHGDNHRLEIGSDCLLQGQLELLGCANRIQIGRATSIGGALVGAYEEESAIEIGADCMFSGFVDIRTSDNHGIVDETGRRLNLPRDVTIGNHVWLGQRVIVLKGAQIGHNTIVGASAVVTGQIPPNSIAAGVPARVLRTGVNWVRELKDVQPVSKELCSVS